MATINASTRFVNVRYVRFLRVEPSPKNENVINFSELSVYRNNVLIPIVAGTMKTLFANNPSYNWNMLTDNIVDSFASTNNEPGSSITLDLGQSQEVEEMVVKNRFNCCRERAVGCELQLLDDKQTVLWHWAFKDVPDATAKVQGAKMYRVGKSTGNVLVSFDAW